MCCYSQIQLLKQVALCRPSEKEHTKHPPGDIRIKTFKAIMDTWLPPRDYVGYGGDSPKVLWPGDKVIAVSFVLNYEEGAEQTPWNGDDQSCDSLHELHYDRPATSGGQRDGVVEDMVSFL